MTEAAAAHRTRRPALELRGVVKRFGAQLALADVDFELAPGEVHGLLGENGAGKTTLMNVASGLLRADAGTIAVDGEPVQMSSPSDAFRHGLGMVHQNYRLVERLTVAENLHVGWRETPLLASPAALRKRAAELSERYELAVDPRACVADLSVGERQRVAILRTVARGARVLVLDEPTAVLTPQESEGLFRIMRAMAADDRSIVLISHKLREVLDVADRVTVLRGGRYVSTLERSECDVAQLARLMVGHELVPERYRAGTPGETALTVSGLAADDGDGRRCLDGVSLTVRRGEIVGVAGVSGNGQSELARVVTGLQPALAGRVEIGGRDLTGARSIDFIRAGVGHIAEDYRLGLALNESAELNAVIKEANVPPIRRGPLLHRGAIRAAASRLLEAAGLGASSGGRRVATMSGGQMQRLMVHREVASSSSLLVAMYPSRGLDVAATEHIHDLLRAARERGVGVLLVSEDLDELLVLSDRVAVVYEGRVAGDFEREEVTRDELGLLMGGAGEAPDTAGTEAA